MKLNKFSVNGKILPIKKATISVLNIEYQYGFGVYETIRVNNNTPFFLKQHIDRLINSAKIVGIEHNFSEQNFKEYTEKLVKKLNAGTYNFKLLLVGGAKKEDCLFYIFPSSPFFPDRDLIKNGVSAITSNFERVFPTAKTLNMLQSYLAYKKAKQNSCYDSLMVDRNEHIREGTRANFFAVKDNVIYKAPKETILDGVTQRVVLSIASKNGYQIQEKDIKKEDLKNFDGFFLTATSIKVMPISQIDGTIYSIPESIRKLMALVNNFFDNCKGIFEDEN